MQINPEGIIDSCSQSQRLNLLSRRQISLLLAFGLITKGTESNETFIDSYLDRVIDEHLVATHKSVSWCVLHLVCWLVVCLIGQSVRWSPDFQSNKSIRTTMHPKWTVWDILDTLGQLGRPLEKFKASRLFSQSFPTIFTRIGSLKKRVTDGRTDGQTLL